VWRDSDPYGTPSLHCRLLPKARAKCELAHICLRGVVRTDSPWGSIPMEIECDSAAQRRKYDLRILPEGHVIQRLEDIAFRQWSDLGWPEAHMKEVRSRLHRDYRLQNIGSRLQQTQVAIASFARIQRASGPLAFFQASRPPPMWDAVVRPASCAACTAIAERSPKAQ
jgi:hypothetical protein